MKTKIIIVEDHFLMRKGICSTLSIKKDEFEVIGEADSGEAFFELINRGLIPNLLLLDIVLPGMSGVEVAKKIKEEHPFIKILIFSSQSDTETIELLLNIGIDGFVSKSATGSRVLYAIRTIMNGFHYYGQDISKIIYDIHIAKKRKDKELLTCREKDILRLCGEGLNVKSIAEQLNISARTVEAHKNNIFVKLDIKNIVEMVRYAIRNGIIEL